MCALVTGVQTCALSISLFGLVHAKGKRGSRRLVDDALDVQPGNATGVFCGLTLAVVKVSGHGNDRLGDFFTQVVFGRFLHFAQRSEEHTSELQSLMRISYAVFCLKKKTQKSNNTLR